MAQMLETLALFPGEPPQPQYEPRVLDCREGRLWIAVHFPRFSLESLIAAPIDRAIVVTEVCDGHTCVIAASDEAIRLGIRPRLKLSAAFALSDSLEVHPRRTGAEQAKLEALADLAMQFTPVVSLEPPAALLLEVGGSLKLFGGLEVIKNSLASVFQKQQVTAHLCAAPTALAALWLARCGKGDVSSHETLAGSLSSVPVEATAWPEKTQALLRGMGMRTLADCMRLPRDGFARRVGRRYLQELDKSRGSHDPRRDYTPPLELVVHDDLGDETVDLGLLASTGERLVARLAEDLRKHQIRVPWFECVLRHFDRSMTMERMHFVDPAQSEHRFVRLLTDRLERLRLAAPVVSMSLRAGPAEAAVAGQHALLCDRDGRAAPSGNGLIERLLAHLGAESLHGMTLVDEHRPEAAWVESRQFLRQRRRPPLAVGRASQRPLWLLAVPKRLPTMGDNLPCYRSRKPLHLEQGPERIESGWWDDGEIGRDYYIASSAHGERLWIFRDRCTSRDWYLHGFFG